MGSCSGRNRPGSRIPASSGDAEGQPHPTRRTGEKRAMRRRNIFDRARADVERTRQGGAGGRGAGGRDGHGRKRKRRPGGDRLRQCRRFASTAAPRQTTGDKRRRVCDEHGSCNTMALAAQANEEGEGRHSEGRHRASGLNNCDQSPVAPLELSGGRITNGSKPSPSCPQ